MDLAFLQQEIHAFFIDKLELYTVTTSVNRYGKTTKSYALALTVQGQITDVSGSERDIISALVQSGTEQIETAKAVLPFGTAVQVNQELKTADGKYWNIVSVNTSQTLTAAHTALLYRRLVT